MKFIFRIAMSASMALAALGTSVANEGSGSAAEAQERLKAVVEIVKSKGAEAAAKYVMGADDPAKCRFKDVVCMMLDLKTNKLMVHTAVPKLVGSVVDDDMLDVDGVSITQQLYGPGRMGKVKWDNKYKFARPDNKKVVPRWAFCEKADDSHIVCVSVSF